jgi:membrane protein required for colicin V production
VNFIDIVVLVVIGMSALIALSSGFVNVVLWILSWVGAVAATVYFFPLAVPITARYIHEPLIANVVTAVVIFLVALFVCAILNQIISRMVRGSAVGALDRSLGLLLGLVIGALIVCGAYMLFAFVAPDRKDWPQPILEARTLPLVERGAGVIRSLIPDYVIAQGASALDKTVKTLEDGKAVNQTIEQLTPGSGSGDTNTQTPAETPAPAPNPNPAPATAPAGGTGQTQGSNASPQGNPDGQQSETGYKDAQRNDLNRLIESSQ